MTEIVHEIDLRDARYLRPKIAGIDAILKGWALLDLPDAELGARGIALFSGLFGSQT